MTTWSMVWNSDQSRCPFLQWYHMCRTSLKDDLRPDSKLSVLLWLYNARISSLATNMPLTPQLPTFSLSTGTTTKRLPEDIVIITRPFKRVQDPNYRYGDHWFECIPLHLNLKSLHPLDNRFRDLVMIQRWSLNKVIGIEIKRRAELLAPWRKHLWFLRLVRPFWGISRPAFTICLSFLWADFIFFQNWRLSWLLFPLPCLLPYSVR